MNQPPVDYIQLNLSNYTDDDVAQLNEWAVWAHERIASLESELPAWRDIETAPKDGTRVILGVQWSDGDGRMIVSSGYWTEHNGGGWVRRIQGEPLYWMPIPVGPRA